MWKRAKKYSTRFGVTSVKGSYTCRKNVKTEPRGSMCENYKRKREIWYQVLCLLSHSSWPSPYLFQAVDLFPRSASLLFATAGKRWVQVNFVSNESEEVFCVFLTFSYGEVTTETYTHRPVRTIMVETSM